MVNHKSLLIGCAAAAVVMVAASSQARTPALSHLTFGQPVALPGVVLTPGAYTFELAPPASGSNIVLVSSRQQKRVVYAGFTHPVKRPPSMPKGRVVTFGEAPEGEPIPIRAWFPVDGSSGYEFVYW